MSNNPNLPVPMKPIESRILLVRGQKVILDEDLADLYGVTTKRLNEQVKRNQNRFPEDFVFHLNATEWNSLRSHFATASRRNTRFLPYAFTEFGALQAANILNSDRAAEMSVYVVRAFIKLREMLGAHHQLAVKLAELEKRVGAHDHALKAIIAAIKQLMAPPAKPRRKIGFTDGKTQ